MSAQKSILNFFKRDVKRNPLVDLVNPCNKKLKSSLDGPGSDSDRTNTVTENIDKSIEQNNELKCDNNNKSIEESNQSGSGILTGNDTFVVPEARLWEKNAVEKNRLKAKYTLLCKNLSILDPDMGLDWFAALEKPLSSPSFVKLNDFVNFQRKSTNVYPPEKQVWTWTKHCAVNEIKVIIIGQDPYHHYGQAHGLSFSVPVGVTKPPSLVNIFKELSKNYEKITLPLHGNLMGWAMQGVLLLNVVLTVEENKPNSHRGKGWEEVTHGFIKYINEHLDGLVFMLWGKNAMNVAPFIDDKKHHILESGDPSPKFGNLFRGNRHFKKCNDILKNHSKVKINWGSLPTGDCKSDESVPLEHVPDVKRLIMEVRRHNMIPTIFDEVDFYKNWTHRNNEIEH